CFFIKSLPNLRGAVNKGAPRREYHPERSEGSFALRHRGKESFALRGKDRSISRPGASDFAHGGKVTKTPLEPTVQDSLCDMQSNSEAKQK
ncbi:MAG: hypothetical protein II094_02015, partial [Oscillospiraceae bacterium]|nr:hypothetical protein [Oscillospiraceae bacterium]